MEEDDLMPTVKAPRVGKPSEQPFPSDPSVPEDPEEPPALVPLPPFWGGVPDLPPVTAPSPLPENEAPRPTVELPWFLQNAQAAAAAQANSPAPAEVPTAPATASSWPEPEEPPWAPSSWRPVMPNDAPHPSTEEQPPPPEPPVVGAPPPPPERIRAPQAEPAPPAWVQTLRDPSILTEEEDTMASDIQWEYCRVQVDSGMYKQTVGRYPYFVRVSIDYYGEDTPPTENFGEDTDQMDRPNKVWGRVVGLLGLANWEMVNVYLGTAKDLSLINVMAYFKRPVQPGRKVNEPKVQI